MRNFRKNYFDASLNALRLLAHPVILAASGLMLVNDLILRRFWPSWWTGKLSDAAWLVIVPLLAAALLGVLLPLPRREPRRGTWIFGLGMALVGLGFAGVKALPVVNILATRIFADFLSVSPALSLDPSDLLALPAMLIPLVLWQRSRARTAVPSFCAPQQALPSARALIALPLVALVLLADAPAPDFGFTCFELSGDKIYASSGYNVYVSADGGRTWENYQAGSSIDCVEHTGEPEGWTEVDGPTTDRRYRYRAGEEIQFSPDGGVTWQTGVQLAALSDAQGYYLQKSRTGSPVYRPGPLDAAADPVSGNMLFAMGQEGIIGHAPNGEWFRGNAGSYQSLENFPDAAAFSVLLGGNIYLSLALALLIFAAGAVRPLFHPIRLIVLLIAWLGWLIVSLIFPPAISVSYAEAITALGILLVALFAVPLVIEMVVRLARRAPRRILPLAALGLGGGLISFLPFVLWVYGVLPRFEIANLAGLIAAAAFAAAAPLAAGKKPSP